MLIVRDNCTPWPVFGGNETLLQIPLTMWNLTVPINQVDGVLPAEYQIATGIMHAIGTSMLLPISPPVSTPLSPPSCSARDRS